MNVGAVGESGPHLNASERQEGRVLLQRISNQLGTLRLHTASGKFCEASISCD